MTRASARGLQGRGTAVMDRITGGCRAESRITQPTFQHMKTFIIEEWYVNSNAAMLVVRAEDKVSALKAAKAYIKEQKRLKNPHYRGVSLMSLYAEEIELIGDVV